MTRSAMTKLCITVAALAGVATVGTAQQPFLLDNGFHTQLANSVFGSSAIGSVVELQDGKLLASGYIYYPWDDHGNYLTTRLMPSGTKDFSFDWSPGGGPIRPWNGKWYVGGGQGVVRLNGDGTQDQGFHFGFSTPQEPSNLFQVGQGGDFAVRLDGGLLLAGSHIVTDSARGFFGGYQLVWMDSIGELDTTMVHRQANGVLWSIQELPDGKFITGGGGVTMFEGRPVGGIIRTLPDGGLDTTFTSPLFTYGVPHIFFPLPNGKILVGGVLQFDHGDTLSLVRLLPNGELDPAFNNALQTMHEYDTYSPFWAPVRSILPWGPDRYIITGRFTQVEGEVRRGIAMIDTAGYLVDDIFSGPGCISPAQSYGPPPNGGPPYIELWGTTVLNSGKLLIYGGYQGYDDGISSHTTQLAISRLHGGSVGIAEHEAVSFSLYPNPATTYATVELEAMPRNGQLVLHDALGREVLRQRVAGYHNTVPLQGLGKGVYLLELREEGTRRVAQRLVVQ